LPLELHGGVALGPEGLEVDGVIHPLPEGAIAAVLQRYGKPLAAGLTPSPTGAVGGVVVMPFMRWGDVEPQAYVVLLTGPEPLAAPAPLVAAALAALAGVR
jgi:hypothetical protein